MIQCEEACKVLSTQQITLLLRILMVTEVISYENEDFVLQFMPAHFYYSRRLS